MSQYESVKSSLLSFIQQYQSISVKMLSTLTRLSIPHVTGHVEELLQAGLLKERTQEAVVAGRKPKLYSLNPDYGFFIGVDMGLIGRIQVGFFDFAGALFRRFSVPVREEESGEDVVTKLIDAIAVEIDGSGKDRRLLHVVIGNPGVIDDASGAIHRMSAESAKWGSLPLRTIFEERFHAPTKVLNDVNLCAIGEKEYGLGEGYQNFLFVRNEIGLKSGIIIKKRLYQGEAGAAGEIGLNVMITPSAASDEPCRAEPVESILSMRSICKAVAKELPEHPEDPFYAATNGDPEQVNVESIARVLGSGSYVERVVRESGRLFGLVLLNAVTTLDIALVIISGDMANLNNYFFKSARDIMGEYMKSPPTVLTSSLDDNVGLYGAYGVGMELVRRNQMKELDRD